jgi:uncharacterized membrane protein
MEKKTVKLTMTAVFAALVFIATIVLPIPIPATGGYINLGDAVLLVAVWYLGGLRGGLAAGIGAGLADLLLAPVYAPGTFVIKLLMGLAAYGTYKTVKAVGLHHAIGEGLASSVAEVIMVGGYFFYESVLLGLGYGAIPGIPGNILQGVANIVIFMVLIQLLQATKITERLMKTV